MASVFAQKDMSLAKGKHMRRKLIIDGNAVYEMDDECVHRKGIPQEVVRNWQRFADRKIIDTYGGKNVQAKSDEKKYSGSMGNGKDIHFCGS